ncbi:MAG: Bug family tripartite tricarboxylate transporter substrate binding protein [Betaproteobacteria bacterium]
MEPGHSRIFALAAVLLALALPALAEYPDKPIKMIVPWPPGGVTDTLARFSGDQLQRAVGQPVVVENKGGANGIIGTQAAAALPADGYGLLAVTAETHAINPSVYKPLPYDPLKDFDPVAMVARVSFVLATRGDLAPNNVKELIAYAKANPGKLSAASYGVGSTSHLGLATFENLTGTSYIHVPFTGVAPAVNALLGGQVDLAFVNAYNVEPHRKTGKVKILAVAGPERLHTIADVPTMAEQGIQNMYAGNWYGFVTPHGVPAAARDKLAMELQKIARSKAFEEKAYAMGVQTEFRDAAQFSAFLREEGTRLGEVVRDKNISIELKR